MFSKIKDEIKELARNGVLFAESELGSGRGQEKKKMAIEYILKNLNCSNFLKNIISILLSDFIDTVIEISVKYLNSLTQEKGE